MSFVKHAVIAAAGFGSRLGLGKPKCLLYVEGMSILEHQLRLLQDVEDVRVVVGFCEDLVLEECLRVRPDVIFVRNPDYAHTTTLRSYALGAQHISEPCLFMDGDIIFDPHSFAQWTSGAEILPCIGITPSKTVDAVGVELTAHMQVACFVPQTMTEFEWANLLYAPAEFFSVDDAQTSVYERLSQELPLQARVVQSWEIDRPADLDTYLLHSTAQQPGDGRLKRIARQASWST